MHILNDHDFRLCALPKMSEIFADHKTTGQWFSPNVNVRKLVYPCFGTFDEAISIETLVIAANKVGDDGCYITLGFKSFNNTPNHCYVPLSELQDGYSGRVNSKLLIGAQLGIHIYNIYTTIFSSTGKWGITILEDGIGILGGTVEFMTTLQELNPDLDNQVYSFLHSLKNLYANNSHLQIEWLRNLLIQVYGDRIAKLMLHLTELE
jgi:hypothetical protein